MEVAPSLVCITFQIHYGQLCAGAVGVGNRQRLSGSVKVLHR